MTAWTDFDSGIYDAMLKGMEKAVAAGLTPDEASTIASEALTTSLRKAAPGLAAELKRTSPGMLRRTRRAKRGFERRLRKHWGSALDLYFIVVVASHEAARDFDARHSADATRREDHLFEALVRLQARAARTALEVFQLLSGGFPKGALSRCRTLHEIAVTAMVLAEHGTAERTPDLAERFLLHEDVSSWDDAKIFQEHCDHLGCEPFSEQVMSEIRHRRDDLRLRFGSNYMSTYGWAAGIPHLKGVTPDFRSLEKLAKVSHLRGHYRWACHEVHADAKGTALNILERGGVPFNLTGATNAGLSDPGHMALISLHQSLVSLLFSPEDISPRDLMACQTLHLLVDGAGEAFAQGESSVEDAEERFQAQREGRRIWLPWRHGTGRSTRPNGPEMRTDFDLSEEN